MLFEVLSQRKKFFVDRYGLIVVIISASKRVEIVIKALGMISMFGEGVFDSVPLLV
jgi:hypothetical protein